MMSPPAARIFLETTGDGSLDQRIPVLPVVGHHHLLETAVVPVADPNLGRNPSHGHHPAVAISMLKRGKDMHFGTILLLGAVGPLGDAEASAAVAVEI
jgi:hypothetical protein